MDSDEGVMKYYKTITQEKLAGTIKSLTEESHFQANDSLEIKKGIFVAKFIFLYSQNGNLIEENRYAEDNSLEYKDIFKFDSKEKPVELTRFNKESNELYKVTYKYNDTDRLVEENNIEDVDYFNLGDDGFIRTFRYDELGNKIEQCQYDAYERLESKYEYKYDDKNNLIEMSSFLIDMDKRIATEISFKYVYEYDNDNNLIAESRYRWNNLFHITNFKYNDKGECIARNYHDFSDVKDVKITMVKIEYKNFDELGNWLMCIEYENDKPRWIHEREIKYY